MRRKIQRSMILVITTTLLITYAITTFVVYRQTISLMEDEIRQEADYICAAVGISGEAYLKEMDAVRKNTRVTMIDGQGRVTYDSKEDEVTLENHKSRPEVKEALSSGSGQDIRKSDTLGLPVIARYPTLAAYVELLLDTPQFFTVFWNSCGQVFPIILGHVLLGAPAAWAFARFDFRGKKGK